MAIKVLNISYDDHANFAHNNANALRSVGVNCEDFKLVAHPFEYESQSKILRNALMMEKVRVADVVQIFHTADNLLTMCNQARKKRVVVYHTGTRYRQNPNLYNAIFNNHVERCFTDQTEFIGLGMKNETYIATAIDTELIYPTKTIGSFINIAHYPSNQSVKGTERILKVLNEIKSKYSQLKIFVDTGRVNQKEQYNRMKECDVYIELWAEEQNGKQYGCYGVTAFEAAAMGKIVITQNLNPEVYKRFYGCSEPFHLITKENPLDQIIEGICNTDYYLLREKQQQTRDWVYENHSMKSTGNYLKKILSI